MKVRILVTPKRGVHHPAGAQVEKVLREHFVPNTKGLVLGRMVEVELSEKDAERLLKMTAANAEDAHIANFNIEQFRVQKMDE